MADLFDLQAKISLDSSEYESGLNDASGKADSFASKLGSGLGNAAKIGAGAIAAVGTAAGAAVGALVQGTGEVASLADGIDKASQKLGISAEAYQEWDAILQHSGSSVSAMTPAIRTLQKSVEGGSESFEALGLSLEEVGEMSNEDLFSAVITGLQNVEDENKRTELANDLLGKSYMELGPLLNTSAEDTEAMRQRVHELGGVMSDEAVKAGAAYQDSLQDMQTALNGIKNNLMSSFLPSITTVMDGLTAIFTGEEGGVQMVTEGINQFIEAISSHIPQIMEVGTSILTSLINAISENIPTLLSSGVDMIMTISDAIIENLPTLVEAALQIILQISTGIAESLPELIPTIVDVVVQIVETLIDNVDLLIDSAIAIIMALADGLIDAVPRLIEKVPEIILKLLNALIENAPKLLEAGLELIAKIGDGLINGIGAILDAGRAIVEGLWQGISNAADWLWNKVSGWVGGLVDGVKGLFGIHSPSTVFADIGENMAEGLGEGFTERMEGVREDILDAMPTVDDLLNSGVDWDKYNDLYWKSNFGLDAILGEIRYNVEKRDTPLQDLLDYLNSEYELDYEDAQKAVDAYLQKTVKRSKAEETTKRPEIEELNQTADELAGILEEQVNETKKATSDSQSKTRQSTNGVYGNVNYYININVDAEDMTHQELAEEIERQLMTALERRQMAWA